MLHHIELGHGLVVVLVHGLAASLRDWDGLLPLLVTTGRRALAVDLLGHGASPKPTNPSAYSAEELLAAFESWIAQLALETPFHLVGHSLGGYLSLAYCLSHPEQVASMVLINPLYTPDQMNTPLSSLRRFHRQWSPLLQALPTGLVEWGAQRVPIYLHGIPPQLRRQKARDLKRASPHILRLVKQLPDLSPCLEQILAPILLIWSDADRTLAPSSFPRLASLLPQVTNYEILRCGHQTHLIRPQEVGDVILRFLDGKV